MDVSYASGNDDKGDSSSPAFVFEIRELGRHGVELLPMEADRGLVGRLLLREGGGPRPKLRRVS